MVNVREAMGKPSDWHSWVSYTFSNMVSRPNLSWPGRGTTAIERARYALNRLLGRREEDGVMTETLRQEFEQAYEDGRKAGFADGLSAGRGREKAREWVNQKLDYLALQESIRRMELGAKLRAQQGENRVAREAIRIALEMDEERCPSRTYSGTVIRCERVIGHKTPHGGTSQSGRFVTWSNAPRHLEHLYGEKIV